MWKKKYGLSTTQVFGRKNMQHELIRKVKLLAVVSMKWLNDMRNIYPVGK